MSFFIELAICARYRLAGSLLKTTRISTGSPLFNCKCNKKKKVVFVTQEPGTSLLSSSIHICLCGRLNLVQTASGAEQPCLSLPSIFTRASQVPGTAGPTLISLKYLFHPSSEQIVQKHWRLFQASANALETSTRQNVGVLGFTV